MEKLKKQLIDKIMELDRQTVSCIVAGKKKIESQNVNIQEVIDLIHELL